MPVRIGFSDERLRRMYAGGRGDAVARRYARFWSWLHALGLAPRRWVTLEVPGRVSGRPTRFPLGMADVDGEWYLVSMLGEECNWVRNVRAAQGRAVLHHSGATDVVLVDVPPAERPAVLRRYLQKVPGARPHVPVRPDAPLGEFAEVAERFPVFRVTRPAERKPPV